MLNKYFKCCVLILFFIFVGPLYSVNQTAFSAAFGSSAAAAGSSLDAVVINPALLDSKKLAFSLSSSVYGLSSLDNVSLFDTMFHATVPVKEAGIFGGYFKGTFDRTDTAEYGKVLLYSAWETGLAYSSMRERKVKLGIAMLLTGFSADTRLIPVGHDTSGQKVHFNMSIGSTWYAGEKIRMSLTVDNFLRAMFGKEKEYSDENTFALKYALKADLRDNIFLGFGSKIAFFRKNGSFNLTGNFYLLEKMLRVTTGIELITQKRGFQPLFGFGFAKNNFQADYAFSYPLNGVYRAGNHLMSLSYRFNLTKSGKSVKK